jgi:hypothetical protein
MSLDLTKTPDVLKLLQETDPEKVVEIVCLRGDYLTEDLLAFISKCHDLKMIEIGGDSITLGEFAQFVQIVRALPRFCELNISRTDFQVDSPRSYKGPDLKRVAEIHRLGELGAKISSDIRTCVLEVSNAKYDLNKVPKSDNFRTSQAGKRVSSVQNKLLDAQKQYAEIVAEFDKLRGQWIQELLCLLPKGMLKLDLSGNPWVTNAMMQAVVPALPSIQALNLGGCQSISNSTIKTIAGGLVNLRCLDLSDLRCLGPGAFRHLSKIYWGGLLQNFDTLILSNTWILNPMLVGTCDLPYYPGVPRSVAQAIRSLPLEYLDIGEFGYGGPGKCSLGPGTILLLTEEVPENRLPESLLTFKVRDHSISSNELYGIRGFKKLRKLWLVGCKIDDVVILSLRRLLKLQTISFDGSTVDDMLIEKLLKPTVDGQSPFPDLEGLSLAFCSKGQPSNVVEITKCFGGKLCVTPRLLPSQIIPKPTHPRCSVEGCGGVMKFFAGTKVAPLTLRAIQAVVSFVKTRNGPNLKEIDLRDCASLLSQLDLNLTTIFGMRALNQVMIDALRKCVDTVNF